MLDAAERSVPRRLAIGGMGAALLAGVAAVGLHRESLTLTMPAACPGLPEAAAVAASLLAPHTPLEAFLRPFSVGALVLATALLVIAAHRTGARWSIAAAAGLAFGLAPMFAPVLAPPDALPFAAVVAAFIAMTEVVVAPRRTAVLATFVGLTIVAMASPSLALVATLSAIVVTALQWRRGDLPSWTIVLAFAPLAGAWLVRAVIPPLPLSIGGAAPNCWMPSPATARDGVLQLSAILRAAGPYPFGLAALGVFAGRRAVSSAARWPMIAFAIFSIVPAAPDARTLGPVMVAFWLLAAHGLDEVVSACTARTAGSLAAVALAALLPGVRLEEPPTRVPADRVPYGHADLSLDQFRRALAVVPSGVVLVTEDAVSDALLRAAHGTIARSGKHIAIIDRWSPSLSPTVADAAAPVLAMPSASVTLQNLGFRMSDASDAVAPGFARVAAGGPCQIVARTWREATGVAAPGAFALIGQDDHARGPLVLYASAGQSFAPAGLGWPPGTTRGFNWTSYDRHVPGREARLAQDLQDDGLTADAPAVAGPYVVRLELWRTVDAPTMLAATFGATPSAAWARLTADADTQRLTICAAFPYKPESFQAKP